MLRVSGVIIVGWSRLRVRLSVGDGGRELVI